MAPAVWTGWGMYSQRSYGSYTSGLYIRKYHRTNIYLDMKILNTKQIRMLLDNNYTNEQIMDVDEKMTYGMPFPINVVKRPRKVFVSGFENVRCKVIYGIFDMGECIYVGQTKNLHHRCQQHCIEKDVTPSQFKILQYITPSLDICLEEQRWIRTFMPKLNKLK